MTSGPASSTGDPWQAGSADAPAPYLLCIEGERATIVQLPRSGGLVIGRGPDCGLRLADELASRTHAQVYAVPDGLRVEDCGSRHGTLVNGRKLTGAKLVGTGDVIGIGSVTLVVHRPRMPAGRALREPQALLKRFDEELERARRFRRELSVVVLRSERPLARTHVTDVVSDQLRLIDVAAVFGTHELVVLVPEAGCDEVTERARALVGALSGVAAGVATSPADGVDADALLSCSRLAATTARLGSVASASDAVRVISLDGRDVVIADPAMVGIYALLERLARTSLPILILGESTAAADNPSELDIWHLPPAFRRLAAIADPDPDPEPERSPTTTVDGRTFRPIDDELRELERARIVSALAATDGVQNRAAALIAMPLRTFVAKLKRYAIDPSEWR